MSAANRDERLEQVAQRVEDVIADRDNHGYLLYNTGRSGSTNSATGVNTSDLFNGDKPQKVPEIVKGIIMRDFGDTDDDEDSLKNTPRLIKHDQLNLKRYSQSCTTESFANLKSENTTLRDSLYTLEEELVRIKNERDNLAIKYNTVNEKYQKALDNERNKDEKFSGTSEDLINLHSLSATNIKLRKQLDEDNREYKRKLALQHDQQLKQSELIKKLQNKLDQYEGSSGVVQALSQDNSKLRLEVVQMKNLVIGYKTKCSKYEDQVQQDSPDISIFSSSSDKFQSTTTDLNRRIDIAESQLKYTDSDKTMDIESLLLDLKEEQAKSLNLMQVTALLREQLNEATSTNQALTEDVQRLTDEVQFLRNELDQKEINWKDDEATFNRYLISEQSKIKSLWNAIGTFKKQFNDMKSSNERELHQLRVNLEQSTKSLRMGCSNFDTNNANKISQLQYQLETEENNNSQMENSLSKLKEEFRKTEGQYQKQIESLNEQFVHINKTNETLAKDLSEKDKVITTLHRLRHGMSGDVDSSVYGSDDAIARQLIMDSEAVHQALKDISQLVMNDDDQVDYSFWNQEDYLEDNTQLKPTFSVTSLHSNRSISPIRTPKRRQFDTGSLERDRTYRSKSPITLAESTCTAVRSALQRRTLQVQDLTGKMNSLKNNVTNTKKQLEDSENERRHLEKQFMDLRNEYDSQHRELNDMHHECERMRHTITMLEEDKIKLDKTRLVCYEESKTYKQDLEKLKMTIYELERNKEDNSDNNHKLERDLERQMKEVERLLKSVENADTKNIRFKEEISSIKETLNRALLDKEVLEQQNSVVIDSLNKSEVLKAEYEVKLNKLKTDETKLRDKLHQLESTNLVLTKENNEYKSILDQTEYEKLRLSGEKKALELEKHGIREELLRVENEKEELNQMKDGLHQSIQNVEKSYENLQDELSTLNYEKVQLEDLNSSLQRERNVLSTELLQARRDAERLSAAVQKSMQEKETMSKEKTDLISQLNVFERELRENSETIYNLQEDKEQMDELLYVSQQNILQLEAKIENLEAMVQETEKKRTILFEDKQRIHHEFDIELQKVAKSKDNLQLKLNECEKDWTKILRNEKQAREDDIERLIAEREELRTEFLKYKEDIKLKFQEEIDDLRNRLNRDKQELAQEIITIQRERDDCLLEAELEKQHIINILDKEKASLAEKCSQLNDMLKTSEAELERTRNECEVRAQQDQSIIQTFNGDLKKFRSQFEQIHIDHDREIKNLQYSQKELENQRYQDSKEIEELRSLLKIAEETRDSLRQDLNESMAKCREIDDHKEKLRRELLDERRNLLGEKKELEIIQMSNKEIREKLKTSEIQKIDIHRQLQDLQNNFKVSEEQRFLVQKDLKETRYNLQEVSKSRADINRELDDLKNQVKKLNAERGKLVNEVGGLQERIMTDEEKEVEARKENYELKQKLMESITAKEDLSKQLYQSMRKSDDLEELLNAKEKSHRQYCDEILNDGKKIEEIKLNLENQLEISNYAIKELRLSLNAKEGRISDLENTISIIDQKRKNAESRLATIHSHLRKLIGFKQQATQSFQIRSPSPGRQSRSISPEKGRVSSRNSAEMSSYSDERRKVGRYSDINLYTESVIPGSDLEPEAVRLALRDVTQHIVTIEKERDDMEIKAKNAIIKSDDATIQLEEALQRINQLQKNFGEVEEDKKGIDSRLSSAQTALMMQEETIHRNDRERKGLIDKVGKLERQLAHVETEKKYLQERVDKLRNAESYHEEERRNLIKAVDDAENRCTQLELLRRGLEGDLQRLKMGFNDKETENQVLRDRIESLSKQISDLESKAQSLQLTVDRLSTNLARTEEEENSQKDKVHKLNLSLSENMNNLQYMQEKVVQLQNTLTSSEHDRRLLQERLECLKHSLSDSKSQNHTVLDQVKSNQEELMESEARRNELEGEVKRLSQILNQRQEVEQDMQSKLNRLTMEKKLLSERLSGLSNSLAGLESERKDIEKVHLRSEKEKNSLKKALDKLEKEKNRSDEYVHQSLLKRNEFDEFSRKLEDENEVMHRQIQKLQNQLTEAEQCHAQRMMELSLRIKNEMLLEIDRLKSALNSTEKTLQFREKSHRQKIKGLEEQISLLKDQLSQEMKKRESYLNKSARNTKTEMSDIKSILDKNINNISKTSYENLMYDSRGITDLLTDVYSKQSSRPNSRLQNNSLSRQNLSTSPTRANKMISANKKLMKTSSEALKNH